MLKKSFSPHPKTEEKELFGWYSQTQYEKVKEMCRRNGESDHSRNIFETVDAEEVIVTEATLVKKSHFSDAKYVGELKRWIRPY